MSDLVERLHKYLSDHDHPAVTTLSIILLTEAAERIEALEKALGNSQSLLAMIHHLGGEYELTRTLWDGEDLTKLTADQITENRAALAPQEQDK